ncbi:LuxR C-terminal-related transcriptional regulator [Solirubrobacter phytolaccae]|uniref:LuxR C-terminal-related transcriptional regulator n=1 Tax=Solirubrobacter phytolaccae TaxID=1404360 RepID=A0A9X3NF60_9ACTN|nr:helix-turn-helix transcriptional regulator [Solirubrobacter phytolaccae]MDA0184994.1 LuxR C-terminal-related transcriptional regulator [Solirubrobacter phytolaccae]
MLVGRESEFAKLAEGVQRAHEARGAALVVRGEAGIGKTALLADLERCAAGVQVLKAHGVESESTLAYAGLTELLHPVLHLLPRLPQRRRTALEAALGLGHEQVNDPFGAYAATLSLLAEAAEDRPVLALVDDAHLLDAESANALRFSARRLANDPVCIVLAMRTGEGIDFESSGFAQVALSGLSPEAARAVLGAVSPEVLHQLHGGTGGNPLALRELARLLSPAQLQGRDRLPDPLPVGPAIARAFGARIEALPEPTQSALVIAAADESGLVVNTARALRMRGLALEDLDVAVAVELVALEDGRLAFAHPLIRSTAYRRAAPSARRDAHLALAEAMREDPPSRARRAWHLASATIEPDEHIAAELERVATDARTRGAPAVAGRALEVAARVTTPGSVRVRRLLSGAAAHHQAGQPTHAVALLDAAMAEIDDPLARADAQRLRAQVITFHGGSAPIRALLIDEAARVELHDPTRAAVLRLDAAMASMMMGEPLEAERLAEQAWPQVRDTPLFRPFAALAVGTARILRGDGARGLPLLEEAIAYVERGDFWALGPYGGQMFMAELTAGRATTAVARSERAAERLRAEGMLSALPAALFSIAWARMTIGEWQGAEEAANESLAIARDVGQRALEIEPMSLLAWLAGVQGRFDEGRALVATALEQGTAHGVDSIRTVGGWVLGRLELSAGDLEAAAATLEEVGRFSLERGMEAPAIAPWAQDLAEVLIRLGRHADAEATLRVLERQARKTQIDESAFAGALRCRGLIADDFDGSFQASLERHEQVPDPFERARTELCFGERLRRAGRRAEARVVLRAALATFERLGAEPWARRAHAELAGSGERARRRTPDTADRLTPQERQVAALVARGATNREAAATLFVSPKTIETHLSHVYRKLGVRSRAELAHRLAAGSTDG